MHHAAKTSLGEESNSRSVRGTSGPVERGLYVTCIGLLFNFFSATRLLTYFPTIWAIYASADSSQHSILTWLAWAGANGSMAAWLYEGSGRKLNKVIVVTACNSVMCFATGVLVYAFR